MIDTILYIIAIILLVLAAFGINPRGIGLGWMGLAFFVLTFLI